MRKHRLKPKREGRTEACPSRFDRGRLATTTPGPYGEALLVI
jgi:hypothetical protein